MLYLSCSRHNFSVRASAKITQMKDSTMTMVQLPAEYAESAQWVTHYYLTKKNFEAIECCALKLRQDVSNTASVRFLKRLSRAKENKVGDPPQHVKALWKSKDAMV